MGFSYDIEIAHKANAAFEAPERSAGQRVPDGSNFHVACFCCFFAFVLMRHFCGASSISFSVSTPLIVLYFMRGNIGHPVIFSG